jgi:ketol-acid reductoisomerase
MSDPSTRIYQAAEASLAVIEECTVAVIGYGNQGRAQALNMRDNGLRVIIGNRSDDYRARARSDGFKTFDISEAVAKADLVMMLLPDEIMPTIFREGIMPYLRPGSGISFASGYTIAFDEITPPPDVDVLLIAPRMIGVGVRERFLSGEGFYCLVGVYQDASGHALERLLALTLAIGGLQRLAIEVTFKQEAILDLFNEQAFGPAFGRVLLTSIATLIENGLPPEAVLVEMYMSEEMAYTYRKMAQVGLVRQTAFHSQTSQYGAMSRGMRFMNLGLKKRMARIYDEIENGDFAREWRSPLTRIKHRIISFFAFRQSINRIEGRVRKVLGLRDIDPLEHALDEEAQSILSDPDVKAELESFERSFDF